MGWFSNYRQRQVLRLEPSRGFRAVGNLLIFLLAGAFCAVALTLAIDAWPATIEQPEVDVPERALFIASGVAASFSIGGLVAGVYDLGRWRLSRRIIKASNDPTFGRAIPSHETVVATAIAPHPPPLQVRFVKPRKLPRPKPLRPVTTEANVIGRPPIDIAYLRLFDNQPRARTFLESAWREFGYIHLLRSATSVTRTEYKQVRRARSIGEVFVHDDETFEATLRLAPRTPMRRGRLVLPNVAPTRVSVRDRYGSYPIRAVLCHGDYWQRAVDILLGRVDMVVIDLSGFTDRNAPTAYELQRVIDRVPIERVVLLCDQRSSRRFLERAVVSAWSQMSAASPNADGPPRAAFVGITDRYQVYRSQQGDQQVDTVRLEANRRQSRRLATAAYLTATAS